MELKICKKCSISKSLNDFYNDKNGKDLLLKRQKQQEIVNIRKLELEKIQKNEQLSYDEIAYYISYGKFY